MTVRVEANTESALYCGVRITTLGGVERVFVEPMPRNEANLAFGAPVQELELWVMLKDGQWLDRYFESPHRASWGRENAIYNRVWSREESEETPLDLALSSGETQDVEFKPYIQLKPREPKSDEFLETVCAFANAGGGTLFIGVSNNSEPIGIEVDLRRTYGKRCGADPECLRNLYVTDLKRLFNEGLSPAIIPEFKWYDLAHRWVIGAFVPASELFVSLIKSGEVFERVGATNRKLRPIDLLPDSGDGVS